MIDLIIPETLHSSLYADTIRLNDDVQEWMTENIKHSWTISATSGTVPSEPVEIKQDDGEKISFRMNIILVEGMLRFENLEDATLFKLRWL